MSAHDSQMALAYGSEILDHVAQQYRNEESRLVAELREMNKAARKKRNRLVVLRDRIDDINRRRQMCDA